MLRRRWIAATCGCLSVLTHAQDLPPGTTVSSASLTGIAQFDTGLDAGGSMRWTGGIAAGSLLRQVTPQFAAGLTLRYDFQQWDFDNPKAFGGVAPWRNVNQPQVGLTFVYAPTEDWTIVVSPSVAWAFASGASTGNAVEYGAVVVATKDFSPALTVGIGAAVFRQLAETRTFPFLAIDWKINDAWRLANPFPAGPTGGAGLELIHTFGEGWEAGVGGTYRSFDFRLDQGGPVPGGIGQNTYIPVFFRLSRNIGRQAQVDLHAAALANGRLNVKNRDGNDVSTDDYRTAPAIGVTLRHRF